MIEQTKIIIQEFEARIKELLAQGYNAQQAVKIAYEEYPVMQTLRDEIQISLHGLAEVGYGGVLSKSITNSAFKIAWAPDGLTLSSRTIKGGSSVKQMVADTLQQQMVRNANYKKNALAIFDGYRCGGVIPEQDIPDMMSKLIKLSNGSEYDKQAFRSAMRAVQRNVNRLTSQNLKVAYNKLLEAIETRNDQALNKALYRAMQERTRYFAERIARTERARAFMDGFLAQWESDEDCVAYQWQLSTAHPKHDICDLYANANLYGLGKGVYPKDKVPSIPVHPHCMCRLKPLFEGQIPDITVKDRIEEGGREYIATLSRKQKEQLLGVYGSREVEAGASWTAKAKAYNNQVLQGRLKIPKSLRNYLVDGKINIEEFAKRMDNESDEAFEKRIWDYIKSPFCVKEFTPRQEIHYKFSDKYIAGRSYYTERININEVVECLYDGELRLTNLGHWKGQVEITFNRKNGIVVLQKDGGGEIATSLSVVHMSNKGLHIVPKKEE